MNGDGRKLKCTCGKRSCREIIADFDTLPADLQQRYIDLNVVLPYIISYLEKKKEPVNTKNINNDKEAQQSAQTNRRTLNDLVCFSHLRWDFVYQRPQHLMSRFAKQFRVFFIEEPVFPGCQDCINIRLSDENVWVVSLCLMKMQIMKSR